MLFPLSRAALSRVAAAVVAVTWLLLAVRDPVPGVPADIYLVLLALAFLARALPVATARERRITFTASVAFASALLVGPWTAGALSIAGYALYASLFGRPDFWRHLPREITYTLATAPVAWVFNRFHIDQPLDRWEPGMLPVLALAAFLFIGFATLPPLLASGLGRSPQGSDARAVAAGELVTFVLGLPFVALLVALRHINIMVGGAAFALSTAAAVWAIRAGVELRALRKQVRAMEALGRQGIDVQNLDSLLAHLLDTAQDLIPFDRAFVWTADSRGEWLERQACLPPGADWTAPVQLRLGEGMIGRVAERRRGVIIADSDDPRWEGAVFVRNPRERTASILVAPLTTGERALGVALFAHREPGRYTPRDLVLVQSVANQVASAIENVRLHQSIRALAVTDGLTGLTNHRRLQEILTEELWRAQRYERPVSVIMCDVDSFKHYNDTYGHPQGDELLRMMAGVLSASVRAVDTVARYGGEEFCIVLPETGRVQAERMAERLRREIQQAEFPGHPEGEPVRKTMSFGVASFPEDVSEPAHLIPLADAALYQAKHSGKNQVQCARRATVAPTPSAARAPRRRKIP